VGKLDTEVLHVIIKGSLHLGEMGHLNNENNRKDLINEYGKAYRKCATSCNVDKFYLGKLN
jgi:hypothetical protein